MAAATAAAEFDARGRSDCIWVPARKKNHRISWYIYIYIYTRYSHYNRL